MDEEEAIDKSWVLYHINQTNKNSGPDSSCKDAQYYSVLGNENKTTMGFYCTLTKVAQI